MRVFFRLLHRGQEGGALLVSVLLIFGLVSLCLPALFSFLDTGVAAAETTGRHTQEIYAAEAGVYNAIWKITRFEPDIPGSQWDPPAEFSVPGGVNGDEVDVTVTNLGSFEYHIVSVATDPVTGHQSAVDTEDTILGIKGLSLKEFTKFAATSNGTITSQYNNVNINGDVWVPEAYDYQATAPTGNITVGPISGWPIAAQLETYYSYLVDTSSPYTNGTIDVSNPADQGPLYASGAGSYVLTGTGTLTGPLYINGDLYVDQCADINLNGNTIFVTGSVTTNPQSLIAGPGSLIAIGDVSFSPRTSPAYLLVMSVAGTVSFQPNGSFVGAVCGNVDIDMQPNCSITWEDPGYGTLDLPGVYNHVLGIQNWTIN